MLTKYPTDSIESLSLRSNPMEVSPIIGISSQKLPDRRRRYTSNKAVKLETINKTTPIPITINQTFGPPKSPSMGPGVENFGGGNEYRKSVVDTGTLVLSVLVAAVATLEDGFSVVLTSASRPPEVASTVVRWTLIEVVVKQSDAHRNVEVMGFLAVLVSPITSTDWSVVGLPVDPLVWMVVLSGAVLPWLPMNGSDVVLPVQSKVGVVVLVGSGDAVLLVGADTVELLVGADTDADVAQSSHGEDSVGGKVSAGGLVVLTGTVRRGASVVVLPVVMMLSSVVV